MDSFEGMSDLYVKCWPEGERNEYNYITYFPFFNIINTYFKTMELYCTEWYFIIEYTISHLFSCLLFHRCFCSILLRCNDIGSKPLETDTHWRCKRGKASWNYRLLFDVELGHSTRLMKVFLCYIYMFKLFFIDDSYRKISSYFISYSI